MKKKKFFTVYQIKNLVDGRIYVGAHSTNKLNDDYWGSSKYLTNDIKKLGKENFEKRILYVFDNVEDMKNKEAEIVTKGWCMSSDTYNRMVGGLESFTTIGMVSVKDKEGNYFKVYKEDPRYLSGEFVSVMKDLILVRDEQNNYFVVAIDDERYLSGKLKSALKNKITVKNDKGEYFVVEKNDKRYLSGELVGINRGIYQKQLDWTGKKHSDKTKNKIAEKAKERVGEKNSQFGTCWVTNGSENKKIKKENLEEWLDKGYFRGRK